MNTVDAQKFEVELDTLIHGKWRRLLDLYVEAAGVPLVFIARANTSQYEILVLAGRESEEFCLGERISIPFAPFFENEIGSKEENVIEGTLLDENWSKSRFVSLELDAILGYRILWPSGERFGILCIMDNHERPFSQLSRKLFGAFAENIQDSLDKIAIREELNRTRFEQDDNKQALREAEEHFQNAFQSLPVGLVISSVSSGKIMDVNQGYQDILGYSCDEAVGKTAIELNLYWNSSDRNVLLEKIRKGELIRSYEMQMRAKNGDQKIVLASLQSTIISGNHCLITSICDITSLRMLQHESTLLNERYMPATRAAQAGIWDWDIVKNVLVWDNQMYRLYDATKEEFGGAYEAWLARIHSDDLESADLESRKALTGEKEYNTEFRIHTANGTVRYIQAYGDVVRDAAGQPLRMVGVNFDITERKNTEEKLVASEARYREIFHNNSAVQIVIDAHDSSIVDANRSACEYYGYTWNELTSLTVFDINPNSKEQIRGIIQESARRGSNHFITQHFRADHSIREVELFNGKISINGRDLLHVIIYDITESTKAITDLVKSEQRFRLLIENAPDGILVVTEGKIAYVNQKATELFHAETPQELVETSFVDCFGEHEREKIKVSLRDLIEGKKARIFCEETI